MRPLRIGIAGTGFGAAIHLPALQSLPGVTVAAICGARQDKAAGIAERCGVAVACQSIEELLAQDLDAVTLALPPDLAERAASLALDRGLAILAEKPLASSSEAAAELARRAMGRIAVVDFEFAELDCFHALRALVADGKLGKIASIDVAWTTQSYANRHGIWSWKTDAARHGGVLTLLGTHILFLLEWITGPIAITTSFSDNTATQKYAPEGCTGAADVVRWQAEAGTGAAIEVALSNSATGPSCHRWTIVGDRGRAVLENPTNDAVAGFRLAHTTTSGTVEKIFGEPDTQGDSRIRPFQILAERFVAAIRGGEACSPDFTVGARVQRLAAQIEAMARNDRGHLRAFA